MFAPTHKFLALLLIAGSALAARPVSAAACCLSASVFGVGRLAVWETAALGLMTGGAIDDGVWGPQGVWRAFPASYHQAELRADLWGIVRVHERGQVSAKLPWIEGLRAAQGVGTIAAGSVGDLLVAGRWDLLLAGQWRHWPAIAVTATLTLPTATRAEQATDVLGAGTTGRGVWATGLAVAVEKAVMPYFLRLDAGLSVPYPFTRADLGVQQRYGVGWQAAVSAGRELVPDALVLALQVLADGEGEYRLAGVPEPMSGARGLNLGVSTSWRFAPQWTWTASASSDAPSAWVAPRNRTERWAFTTGIRYAFQE